MGRYTNYYNRKVDKNQKEIVEVLRKRGFYVALTHRQGDGYPDLHVSKGRRAQLIEVKDGNEALTPKEEKFHTEWQGPPIAILRSIEDALTFEITS